MNRCLRLNFFRTLSKAKTRFFAMMLIVALGCGFYAGLQMVGPTMRVSLKDYASQTHFYNAQLVSNFGFGPSQIKALEGASDVQRVVPIRTADVQCEIHSVSYTTRVEQLTDKGVKLDLVEGSMPSRADQCLIGEYVAKQNGIHIGDRVDLPDGGDGQSRFSTDRLTITGIVKSSEYLCHGQLGNTSEGSGTIKNFLYVPVSTFASSYPYTALDLYRKPGVSQGAFVRGIERRIGRLSRLRSDELSAEALQAAEEQVQTDPGYDHMSLLSQNLIMRMAKQQAKKQVEVDMRLLTPMDNTGYAAYANDSYRMDNIASVFPLMFFLVAAFVTMSSMARMVSDERMELGTLKALGYTKTEIARKYLLYALLASISGGLIGIDVASQLLPKLIIKAYSIAYNVQPPTGAIQPDWFIYLRSFLLGVAVVFATAWYETHKILKKPATELMGGTAPQAGGHILAERFKVWKRLSFSWKVSIRNIFRFKKRLAMTIIGIAGCTALVLTGLGLRDSISDTIHLQYGSKDAIDAYTCTVQLKDSATAGQVKAITDFLRRQGGAETVCPVYVENVAISSSADVKQLYAQMMVPEDEESFTKLVHLRDHSPLGATQNLSYVESGIIISDKLAQLLQVHPGDTVDLYLLNAVGQGIQPEHTAKVFAVCEYYIGHMLYTDKEQAEQVLGHDFKTNTLLADVATDAASQSRFIEAVQELPGVKGVSFNSDIIDMYTNYMASVNAVVGLLIVSAAILAAIVLYNLITMNIMERRQEIASLMVLGFTHKEVIGYVFREIIISVILGDLVGLGVGTLLEGFVIRSSEVDNMMFGRAIHPASYLMAFIITLIFTVIIILAVLPGIFKIDMVESLKSRE